MKAYILQAPRDFVDAGIPKGLHHSDVDCRTFER